MHVRKLKIPQDIPSPKPASLLDRRFEAAQNLPNINEYRHFTKM
ncbi:hypothetical protein BN1221_03338c [Brenneria goodwinii]|uniref:Uncharacterized protein n=1 Tax=Brenneria goodwinii TaxID=1109412 RepID=A0A0G4JY07_9GAMM|nr:hypothetical protein BN1221_03338c [Brenneria goodwinii]